MICMNDGIAKFKSYAVNVWDVDPNNKTDEQIAKEGLLCMENWMKEISVVMNISELGVTENMLDGIINSTLLGEGGYKTFTKTDVRKVLENSLK